MMTAWPCCRCGEIADLNGPHADGLPVCSHCAPDAQPPILSIELVPAGSWGVNLRSILTGGQWDKLRKQCYAEAGHVCEVCGDSGLNQGRNHAVEAHEIWIYDDLAHTQTLERIVSLCPRCHQAKHYGRQTTLGFGAKWRTLRHIAQVNGWTIEDAERYGKLALLAHSMRSRYTWQVNIEKLSQLYGINIYTGGIGQTTEMKQ